MIVGETAGSISIDMNNYFRSSASTNKSQSTDQLNTKSKARRSQNLNEVTCIYFLLMLQIPLHYIIGFADLICEFGVLLVSVTYILLVLFVGMPIYMIIILMGQYCRKGFIKFWQCIPLLKGMGYSISCMLLLNEVINCTLIGMCLLFLPETFTFNLPWTNCKFENASKTCISMTNSGQISLTGCKNMALNEIPTFSTQDFYKYNKLQLYPPLYTSRIGPMNINLAIAVTFIWISVSVFMLIGFKRFEKFFLALIQLTFLALVLIFVATLFLSRKYHPGNKLFSDVNSITDIKLWLSVFMHVCDRTVPGTAIYLISITNNSLKPNVVALLICGLKIAVFALMMLWFPLLMQNIMNHYQVKDPSCFKIDGYDILFAVIPDVLTRMSFPHIWLTLWFLILINLGYISLVFTCTATLDTLVDAHPLLNIYHAHLCFVLCGVCCALNLIIVTPLSMVIIKAWSDCGMDILRTVILTMVTFSLIFIYSLARISTDYHFAYEQPVGDFWVRCWKILPFLILFQTVFILYSHKNSEEVQYSSKTIDYSTYVIAMFVLLPIFIVMLCIYSKHIKHQTVSTIVKADADWGYYNSNKRVARIRFSPYTEVRHKTKKLKCNHECLIHSKKLRKLQQLSNVKKFLLLAKQD